MKRMWIGMGILLVILAISLTVAWVVEQVQKPITETLTLAADCAGTGNWEEAETLCREAKSRWDKHWHFDAAVADHEPMEEIDALFAELEVFCHLGEAEDFASLCARLSRLTQAMADAHKLNWWNLL